VYTLGCHSHSSFRQVKDICQTWFICSHTIHSLNFFKRNTISFWPKRRRHHLAAVLTRAATSRTSSRPMGSTNPHIPKQSIPSPPARHTRRGSYPLHSESRSRSLSQRRSNRAQSPVIAGRGPTKFLGVWVSTLLVRTLTGVALRIQPRPRPWELSQTFPVIGSTP
jgi:hypothetical protein